MPKYEDQHIDQGYHGCEQRVQRELLGPGLGDDDESEGLLKPRRRAMFA
jgi:hypothetical protein